MRKQTTRWLLAIVFVTFLISIIGASSWLIVKWNYKDVTTEPENQPTVDLPPIDTSASFVTSKVYDGTLFEMALTDVGKFVYGITDSNAEFGDYFTVELYAYVLADADNYQNPTKGIAASSNTAQSGIFAGKHFYKIVEKATGQVVCENHVVEIAKRSVLKTDVKMNAANFKYDGTEKTVTFTGYDDSYMTVSGNTQKNAGNNYEAKVQLKDTQNYQWVDSEGNIADYPRFEWAIAKATVAKPTLTSGTEFVYNGTTSGGATAQGLTFDFGGYENLVNVSGASGSSAGEHTASITLKDPGNYEWIEEAAGTPNHSNGIEFNWSIAKKIYTIDQLALSTNRTKFAYEGDEMKFVLKHGTSVASQWNVKIDLAYLFGEQSSISVNQTFAVPFVSWMANFDDDNCGVDIDGDGAEDTTISIDYTLIGTVKSGSKYYANIESALGYVSSGTIVAIQSFNVGESLYTANVDFDHIIANDITIPSGVTIEIPYNKAGGVLDRNGGDTDGTYGSGNEYGTDSKGKGIPDGTYNPTLTNRVVLKSGKKITNNGTLSIGGVIGVSSQGTAGPAGATSGAFAILELESGSTIVSTNQLNVYGFIIETENNTANIEVDAGTITLPFAVHDYHGGSHTVGAYDPGGESPFNIFDTPNAQAKLRCKAGATMKVLASLFTGAKTINVIITYDSPASYNQTEITLLGTSNALFNLTSGFAYFDYDPEGITQDQFKDGQYTYNKETHLQQSREAKTHITLAGNTTSGALKMHIVIVKTLVERDVDLSTVFFPVSYKIDLALTGSFDYKFTNDFKFLPGSSLTIGEGAKVSVDSNSSLTFYDDYSDGVMDYGTAPADQSYTHIVVAHTYYPAKYKSVAAVCNLGGKLTVSGEFAGTIVPTSSSAQLDLSNAKNLSITTKEVNGGFSGTSGSSVTVYKEVQHANGQIFYLNLGSKRFDKNAYTVVTQSSGEYYWRSQLDIAITYDSNGGTSVSNNVNKVWSDVGVTITEDMLPDITRAHYTFGGWYLDAGFKNLAKDSVILDSTVLYAKWTPVTYNVDYDYVYQEGLEADIEKQDITYDFDMSFISLPTPSVEGYTFEGWYWDAGLTNRITGSVDIFDVHGKKIYGYWIEETTTITVHYKDDAYNFGGSITLTEEKFAAEPIKEIPDYLSDTTKQFYFSHWEDENGNKITALSELTGATEYTLNAVWIEKYKLTIVASSSNSKEDTHNLTVEGADAVYLADDGQITEFVKSRVAEATKYDSTLSANRYFIGWNGSILELKAQHFGSDKSLTITAQWADKVNITVATSSVDSPNSTSSTVKVNGSTITDTSFYVKPGTTINISANCSGQKSGTLNITYQACSVTIKAGNETKTGTASKKSGYFTSANKAEASLNYTVSDSATGIIAISIAFDGKT